MYFYDESGVFRTKRATFWDVIRYKLARNRVKVIKNDQKRENIIDNRNNGGCGDSIMPDDSLKLHQCLTDNEFDIEIKCHKCKRVLTATESELCWDYLKHTKW